MAKDLQQGPGNGCFTSLMNIFGLGVKGRQTLFQVLMVIAFTTIGFAAMSTLGAGMEYYSNSEAYDGLSMAESSVQAFKSTASILSGLVGAGAGLIWGFVQLRASRGYLITANDGTFVTGMKPSEYQFINEDNSTEQVYLTNNGQKQEYTIHNEVRYGATYRSKLNACCFLAFAVALFAIVAGVYTGAISGASAACALGVTGIFGVGYSGFAFWKNRQAILYKPTIAAAGVAWTGMKKAGKAAAIVGEYTGKAALAVGTGAAKVTYGATKAVVKGTGHVVKEIFTNPLIGRRRRMAGQAPQFQDLVGTINQH